MPVIRAQDGSEISYTDQGAGPPVLFLHGWLMSQQVWHYQLPLAATLRLITLDLRGHGKSGATVFSYAACLSDIETLLDHLGLDTVVLAGWSMGSQLAIMAAAKLTKRLSGLILVSGTSCFCTEDDSSTGLPSNEIRGMAIRIKRAYHDTSRQFFSSMFSPEESASLDLRALAAQSSSPLPPLQVSLAALAELSSTDLRQLLPGISLPVLLIHGDKDSICPVGSAIFMAEQLPCATTDLFPGSGHAPFLSSPERFNAALSGFVRTANGRN